MSIQFIKSELPDLSQWEEMELVECIGTPEEHADQFYRWESYGIEVHEDGSCQAYVIIDGPDGEEEPIMVAEGFSSPEEVINFFKQESGSKALSDSAEAPTEEGEPVPGAEGMSAPEAEISVEIEAESTDDTKSEKQDDESEDKEKSSEKDDKMTKSAINKAENCDEPNKQELNIDQPTDLKAQAPTTPKTASAGQAVSQGVKKTGLDETVASSGDADKSTSSVTPDLDTVAHADETKLPTPDTSLGGKVAVPTGHTTTSQGAATLMKSFSEMMAEREAAKHRGLPNGYYQSTDATVRKSACQGSPGYGLGRDKDWIDMMPKTPTGQYSKIDGVNQKFMKGADTIEGMIARRRYGAIFKSKLDQDNTDDVESDPSLTGGDTGSTDNIPEDVSEDEIIDEEGSSDEITGEAPVEEEVPTEGTEPAVGTEAPMEGGADPGMEERIAKIQSAPQEYLDLIDILLDSMPDSSAGADPEMGDDLGAEPVEGDELPISEGEGTEDPLLANQKPETSAGL